MPLSEHEQRILDEIERRLAAEDPKFARATAVATPRGVATRRVKRSATVFFSGLVLLISGLVTGLDNANLLLAFGLAGFVVMLSAVVLLVRAWKDLGTTFGRSDDGPAWLRRIERRWRDRREDDPSAD